MGGVTASPRPRPRPWRRRLRRGLIALLVAWLVVTLASVAFNAATTPPYTLAPTSGADVDVAGTRVHYERWGAAGTPIVLVHGFAESTASWQPAALELARRHEVFAVDLAGSGYTAYTGRYGLDDQAGLVAGFIRALDIDRPVLVGHSMGAAVVGAVALAHPSDVGGVVFTDGDALPFGDPNQPPDGRRAPAWIGRVPYVTTAYRAVTGWPWLSARVIEWQCGTVCSGVTPELVAAWMRPLQQGAAQDAMFDGAGLLALTADQVRRISVPRGIIWGAQDADSGGSLAAAQRNLGDPPTQIIANAGHLSMVADPAAFAAATERIIATMSQTQR